MSTRGIIGVVIDGVEKITYNHSDSYPTWLGVHTLKWLRDADLQAVADQARALRVVSEDEKPTAEDIAALAPWTNLSVSTGKTDEWYCLLRGSQGILAEILACGYLEDGVSFAADSLFCEWGYVLDLDRAVFQVYQGFQHAPHDKGRFAGTKVKTSATGDTYYPIALIAEWSLERLPSEEEMAALEDS